MNPQLLLLLALVGPFCAFTHASPTEIPIELTVVTEALPETEAEVEPEAVLESTDGPKEDFSVITEPLPTDPAVAAEEEHTEALEVHTHTVTEAPEVVDVTDSIIVETEAPTGAPAEEEPTAAAEVPITDAPAPVETEAPTEPAAEPEPEEVVTAAMEVETDQEVVVEDGAVEGLSSGQVVGIVIGALVAVVFVVAVGIAVVRRMGKYSP